MSLVNFPKPYFPLTKCEFSKKVIQVNFSNLLYSNSLIYLSGFIPKLRFISDYKVNKT